MSVCSTNEVGGGCEVRHVDAVEEAMNAYGIQTVRSSTDWYRSNPAWRVQADGRTRIHCGYYLPEPFGPSPRPGLTAVAAVQDEVETALTIHDWEASYITVDEDLRDLSYDGIKFTGRPGVMMYRLAALGQTFYPGDEFLRANSLIEAQVELPALSGDWYVTVPPMVRSAAIAACKRLIALEGQARNRATTGPKTRSNAKIFEGYEWELRPYR